ncbi:hypothetical protein FOE78_22325 [Microlunatus elymi]|uniref:DUF7144 domain-containing protein n=1 Tax=Microlunatus elymi TaxID=2596828 RepID=A0A516Q497_9ACTN|nr:hypothetical protein [Microlunatus elymi]QDP98277.1 hypothetical protein FOE78_22325 [Microlunatus elymi]
MAEQAAPQFAAHEQNRVGARSTGEASGFLTFASVIMIMAGAFQAFTGLVAIVRNEFYVATRNYILQFDTTAWGWIHLILGALVLLAGIAVLSGQSWGRVVGIVMAGIGALGAFGFMPYYPFWTIVIIALDVFVIWALAVHGREASA